MPPFFRLNAVNAAVFMVQRRQRTYFSDETPLTPLFFQLKAVNAVFFRLNPVKATILLFKRR